jgi:prepilin-type N-terminal cleavage/methylation domain-containing protein
MLLSVGKTYDFRLTGKPFRLPEVLMVPRMACICGRRRGVPAAGGFTLVELLVVIAIIGLLVGLLLPAVQSAREAGRRNSCVNNLKQQGIGLHLHHDAKGGLPGNLFKFPLNNVPTGSTNWQQGSMHVYLLPYIEQSSLYDGIKFNNNNRVDLQVIAGGPLCQQRIATFQCPSDMHNGYAPISDDFASDSQGNAVCNYFGSEGPNAVASGASNGCPCANSASYNTFKPYSPASLFSNSGPAGTVNPAGMFSCDGRQWKCKFKFVTDGLSKTIMMGETRLGCSYAGDRGWASSWNADGGVNTLTPLNYDSCIGGSSAAESYAKAIAAGKDGCAAKYSYATSCGFKSRHPGTVMFLMGDGAVRPVSENCDHSTLQLFGCRADGRAAGADL